MELQKRIASVASSKVRLLDFVPPRLSNTTVDSSEIRKKILKPRMYVEKGQVVLCSTWLIFMQKGNFVLCHWSYMTGKNM